MFDDQPINDQGQTPPNLPISEPEDMLAGVDKLETPVPPASQQAEAPVSPQSAQSATPANPSALGAGILKPKSQEPEAVTRPVFSEATPTATPAQPAPSTADQTSQIPPEMPAMPEQQEVYSIKEPTLTRGLVTIIVVAVVVVVLGGGGWWIYSSFMTDASEKPAVPEVNQPVDNSALPAIEQPVVETTPTPVDAPADNSDVSADIVDEQILFGEPIDKDGDGLDDNREADLGTNPNNWDTDGDELGDGDEVIIWKTDPLNPDSDGDGYKDGEEVKNGYNPAGEGKIFEPPLQ